MSDRRRVTRTTVPGHGIKESDPYTGEKITTGSGDIVAVKVASLQRIVTHKFGKPKNARDAAALAGTKAIVLFEGSFGGQPGYFDLFNGRETRTVADHWTDSTGILYWEVTH